MTLNRKRLQCSDNWIVVFSLLSICFKRTIKSAILGVNRFNIR